MALRDNWTPEQRAAEKRRMAKRPMVGVRLPPELVERLKDEAEARELSVNYLINQAIKDFLDRLVPADEWKLTR